MYYPNLRPTEPQILDQATLEPQNRRIAVINNIMFSRKEILIFVAFNIVICLPR